MSCRDCRRGEPCARCLAEGDTDHSTVVGPGHVLALVPNFGTQKTVGAFTRAAIEAHMEAK